MPNTEEKCCYCHRPLDDIWKTCENCNNKCHIGCGWFRDVKGTWNNQVTQRKIFQCWTCHTATLYAFCDIDIDTIQKREVK